MKVISTAGMVLAMIFTLCAQAEPGQSRIINGKPATTTNYPWIASLFIVSEADSESGGGCGGSLIADRWVLTAAHCFQNDEGTQISEGVAARTTVTLGSSSLAVLSGNAVVTKAKQVIVHPDYNPNSDSSNNVHDYDIALVELDGPVNITPIRLYTGAIPAHIPAIIAGWGATVGDGTAASDDLQETQLLTSKASICTSAHEGIITANMFCAGGFTDTDTSDTCQGDSGGPLFVMLEQGALQLGITSFGGSETADCGTPGSPGVYANISELFSFINSHVPNTTVLNSLANKRTQYNTYDGATESVVIPKVYGDGKNYSVTLKHTGDMNFVLSAADENNSDRATANPSFFDGATNILYLPMLKVGAETYNVRLKHLGDFKFVLEAADSL
jgi:secreted trypsin-like serine protease